VFNEFLKLSLGVLNSFNNLDDGGKKFVLTVAAIAAAAGPAAIVVGGVFKAASIGAKALAFFAKTGAGVTAMLTKMVTPAVQTAAGVTAVSNASAVAAPNVQKLGLSLGAAVGWFAALAPVAHAAGEAIGNALGGGGEDWKLPILTAVEAKFREIGLSATEAATARRLFAAAADKGEKVELQALATQARLVTAQDAKSRAFRKSIDDAIDEAVAMDEAQK